MSWWIWVCLWTVLVLCSAALLAVLGWRTAAKFFRALDAVGRFGEQTDLLQETAAARPLRETPQPGILVPTPEARRRYLEQRRGRHDRRVERRVDRRDRLGQPQNFADLRSGAQKGMNHGQTS